MEGFKCKARNSGTDPPQDCEWPNCGCDTLSDKPLPHHWSGQFRDGYRCMACFVKETFANHYDACPNRADLTPPAPAVNETP